MLAWEPLRLGGRLYGGVRWEPAEEVTPRGRVLILHEFDGLGPESLWLLREWRARGWGGVAADLYGVSLRPRFAGEAALRARALRELRGPLRARVRGWWEHLLTLPGYRKESLLLFGSSFGGHAVLEGLRAGLRPLGALTVYGYLDPSPEGLPGDVPLLAIVAGKDAVVPPENGGSFLADWGMRGTPGRGVLFPGAPHGFLRPGRSPEGRVWAKRAWCEVDRFLSDLERGEWSR